MPTRLRVSLAIAVALTLTACGKGAAFPSATSPATPTPADSTFDAAASVAQPTRQVIFGDGKFAIDIPANLTRRRKSHALDVYEGEDGTVALSVIDELSAEDAVGVLALAEARLKQPYRDMEIVRRADIKGGEATSHTFEARMTDPRHGEMFVQVTLNVIGGKGVVVTVIARTPWRDYWERAGNDMVNSLKVP